MRVVGRVSAHTTLQGLHFQFLRSAHVYKILLLPVGNALSYEWYLSSYKNIHKEGYYAS